MKAAAVAAPPGDDEREAHFRTQSPDDAHDSSGLSKPIQKPIISVSSQQIPFSFVVWQVEKGAEGVLKSQVTIHSRLPATPNTFPLKKILVERSMMLVAACLHVGTDGY